jgi:hypothetical protein
MTGQRKGPAIARCSTCGIQLGLLDRLRGYTECRTHRAATAATRDQARARYLGALTGFDLSGSLTPSEARTLAETDLAVVGVDWHHRVARSAIAYLLDQALADELLTADEDATIARLARLATVDLGELIGTANGLSTRVMVARVNAGRLPTVVKPVTRLRRREVCHLEVRASLMTTAEGAGAHVDRGINAAKGTRIDYARLVNQLAPLAGGLRAWDDGHLVVTDQRVFFDGNHLAIQVPHRRLIGYTLFKDGLRLRIAGRKAEPIFRVAEPLVVAAVAGGAWATRDEAGVPKVFAVESFDGLGISPADSSKSGSAPARG